MMTSDQAATGESARTSADPTAGAVLAWARSGPTVLRIALGAQLRRLREASNITPGQAAEAIRGTQSKISRLERGRSPARQRDIADLLTLYGVTDQAEREQMLALTRHAAAPGWWQPYNDILPRWLELYIGLEQAASVIRSYEVQFVHGLMQTEDYARAVIRLTYGDVPAEEIDRRVRLRMERQQQTFARPDPSHLWAVVDEAALRRPIGGTDVMRKQLETLAEASMRPNIRIQVIPFRVGGHAAAGGAFTILRFPDPELPDMVYVEQLTSALYIDKREDIYQYAGAIERLFIEAEPPTRTPEIMATILQDLG
jgi:transcriptional regulator with XRE-family HTH domain